jgi:septal ring factor EnvC (AmiA/AmiB activator)
VNDVILVGVLAAIGGGAVAAFISGLFQSPKTRAEAAKLVAEQGQTIDGRWERWSNELEERLERERESHRAQLDELRLQAQAEVEKLNARLEAVEAKLAASEDTVRGLREELATAERTVSTLQKQVDSEKRVTRSVIGWAIAMRDEIRMMGGQVPDTPKMVEDYINEMGDSSGT